MRLVREAERRPLLVEAMASMLVDEPLEVSPHERKVIADALAVVGTDRAQEALADAILHDDLLEVASVREYIDLLIALYHLSAPAPSVFTAVTAVLPELTGRARDQALMSIGAMGRAAGPSSPLAHQAKDVLEAELSPVLEDDGFVETRKRGLLQTARAHWDGFTDQERWSWLHSVHGWRVLEGEEVWNHGSWIDRDRWVNATVWAIAHELDGAGAAPDHHVHGRVLASHARIREAEAAGSPVYRTRHGGTVSEASLEHQVRACVGAGGELSTAVRDSMAFCVHSTGDHWQRRRAWTVRVEQPGSRGLCAATARAGWVPLQLRRSCRCCERTAHVQWARWRRAAPCQHVPQRGRGAQRADGGH